MDIKSIVDSYRKDDSRDLIDKITRIIKAQEGKWDLGIDESSKDLTAMLLYEYSTAIEKMTDGKVSAEFVIRKLTTNMGTFRYGDFKRKEDDHITYGGMPVTSEAYKLHTRVENGFGAHQVDYKDETGRPKFSVVLFDDKQKFKTRDGRKFLLHGIDLSDLNGIRHTAFHEWTHIMEKSFVRSSTLKKEDVILEDGDSIYINACLSADLEMFEYKNFILNVDKMLESGQDILFGGISTIEINEKKSPYRRIMHNQISEGATEYIALEVMKVLGFEVKDKSRYEDRRKIVNQIFSSIGKKQAIADYLTSSNKLISMLESRKFNGKPLLQASDNMVTKLGKTDVFFKDEFRKCEKDYREFDKIKDEIQIFWNESRRPEEADVETVFSHAKSIIPFSSEVSEDLARRHIGLALSFDSDMKDFKANLDREFPIIIRENEEDKVIKET